MGDRFLFLRDRSPLISTGPFMQDAIAEMKFAVVAELPQSRLESGNIRPFLFPRMLHFCFSLSMETPIFSMHSAIDSMSLPGVPWKIRSVQDSDWEASAIQRIMWLFEGGRNHRTLSGSSSGWMFFTKPHQSHSVECSPPPCSLIQSPKSTSPSQDFALSSIMLFLSVSSIVPSIFTKLFL